MKLIFLDVDGVLNNTQNIKKYRLFFRGKRRLLVDVKPFVYLKKLLKEIEKNNIDAKIVISSSWRVGSIASDWKKLFLHYFNNAEIVIGRTPYLYKDRGIEILELIEIAKEKGHMIDDYIVLDDDIEDIINHIPNNKVIKINRRYGLTSSDTEQILKKLK
jgi:hypothetical protein